MKNKARTRTDNILGQIFIKAVLFIIAIAI